MRILHVSQPIEAGVADVVASLVVDQVRRGWDVAVASPVGDLSKAVIGAGAQHICWDASRDPGRGLPREVASLRRITKDASPDLVHLHSSKAGLAGRLALRGRIPSVFQPHAWSFLATNGLTRRSATLWERVAARWATAVLCVSADEMHRGAEARVRARWEIIPNGIDLDRFLAVDAARPPKSGRQAVCVGRLCRQKGQDILLSLWPSVRAKCPDAELVLVGDGPDRSGLEQLAVSGVTFVGWASDVRPYLLAADIALLPSRWEAGLPLVAMQAMAAGLPLVAHPAEGVRDGVGAGGAVIDHARPSTVASAIAERLCTPALATAEGAAGRQRAEERFSREVAADRVARLYQTVLDA